MNIPLLGTEITLNDDPELIGVGLTIFVSGCPHKCKECHNKISWKKENGVITNLKEIKNKIKNHSVLIKYVCFCGGEPLLYKNEILNLSQFCKQNQLKTILYTGYLFKEIDNNIVNNMDIIIDGKYKDDMKTNYFPASKNQNIFINKKKITEEEIFKLQINKNI